MGGRGGSFASHKKSDKLRKLRDKQKQNATQKETTKPDTTKTVTKPENNNNSLPQFTFWKGGVHSVNDYYKQIRAYEKLNGNTNVSRRNELRAVSRARNSGDAKALAEAKQNLANVKKAYQKVEKEDKPFYDLIRDYKDHGGQNASEAYLKDFRAKLAKVKKKNKDEVWKANFNRWN